ncbi:MAG TPA: mechanosensitive ion channel family protein [Rubricoccaceae bacterium]|nr:mechanosensitive ion channel family protein [Rubricoccaceae bacterium]
MSASPLRKLRLSLSFAVLLGAAYVTAYVFEGSPPGLGLEVGLLRWLFAAFLAALGVVGVQVVRFFVLDVVFLRAQGHRAPALVHVVVAMALYFVLGLFIAGGVFHQTLTGAIATSAVASVVLGLALQETLGNFFAGIALQVEQPFRLGDVVHMNGLEGRVEAFNWRATTIRTVNDSRVVIPNALVAREAVEVFARDHLNRRILRFRAPYEVAPQRVVALVREAVRGVPGLSDRQPPQVRLGSFDDSSAGYEVLYWVEDYLGVSGIDARVRERVWYVFARNGIPFPYPHEVEIPYAPPRAVGAAGDGVAGAEGPEGAAEERERWLGEVDLFAPLAPEERRRLAACARTLLFAPGEQILHTGGEGGSMFVVVRGRVEIRVPKPDGGRVRVSEIRPGEVFGEMSLLTGEPRSADAWALDEVEVVEVRKGEVKAMLERNEALAEALARQVSARLDERSAALAQADVEAPPPPSQASLLQKIRRFFDLG